MVPSSRRLSSINEWARTVTSSPRTASCRTLPVADRAAGTEFGFAKQLHAGLEPAIFSRGNFGIDENRLRQLDGHTGGHQLLAFTFSENTVHFGQIGAGVAAEHFPRIRSDLRKNSFSG